MFDYSRFFYLPRFIHILTRYNLYDTIKLLVVTLIYMEIFNFTTNFFSIIRKTLNFYIIKGGCYMIKVCQIGLGRTGQYIAKGILKQKNMELVAAVCSPSSEKLVRL